MAKKIYDNWSKEELVREVEKLEKKLKKNYGLVWEDRLEKVAELCKEKLPVLVEDKSKEIITDNKPTNILIEGDNYHAISVLNYTHKGRIDTIYIDPPYNTGNKDFKYNDSWVDSEDSYRHSKWLSFMGKRLVLSRSLLSNKGIIFISIDDNEVSQLKLLCDGIFGESNFVSKLVWQTTQKNDPKLVAINHEYILCYAKNKNNHKDKWRTRKFEADLLQSDYELLKKEYGDDVEIIQKELRKIIKSKIELKPVAHYKFVDKKGVYFAADISDPQRSGPKHDFVIHPVTKKLCKPPAGGYSPREEEMRRRLLNDEIHFGPTHEYVVCYKKYLETSAQNLNSVYYEDGRYATRQIEEILGKDAFENPKPLKLLKMLFSFTTKKDSIVLDFFAGSGSTGNAILEMNQEDFGKRKFILCTNNEVNYKTEKELLKKGYKQGDDKFGKEGVCQKVCYPRLNKVVNGYKGKLSKKTFESIPGDLKYFKTDFVDAEPTDRNKKKLVDKSTEMLCLKEDCFNEVKKGSDFKVFKNSQNKYLGIIYDDDGIESFKKEAKKIKNKFVVYVFSLDESAREEEFEDMGDMVKLKPIPAVILNVYKRIFK